MNKKWLAVCAVAAITSVAGGARAVSAQGVTRLAAAVASTPGIDVNSWQGTINWTSVHNAGIQYAYIKATEGTSVRDAQFNANYPNAYYAGVIRGAYHLAKPNLSTGAAQADFLAGNGGAWSADGMTLPAALDLEPNPASGGYCYGLSQSAMVSWISSFINEYKARTTRYAVIHTTLSFWKQCTGNTSTFASHSPLSIIHWDTVAGGLPAGWTVYTFWQSTDCQAVGGVPGCAEGQVFNGARDRLVALANNT
jgi:GH25 family lysozyme M1 (1,4-beta-N-acetylmuramidase)